MEELTEEEKRKIACEKLNEQFNEIKDKIEIRHISEIGEDEDDCVFKETEADRKLNEEYYEWAIEAFKACVEEYGEDFRSPLFKGGSPFLTEDVGEEEKRKIAEAELKKTSERDGINEKRENT